jgi:hypothetical protein
VNDDNAAAGGFDPNDLTTGQVVGIAVGAAFALGAVMAALGPNEPEKPSHNGGRRTVVRGAHGVVRENPSTAGLSVVQNGKVSGRTRKRLEQEAAALQQEIERLGKIAEQQERKEQPPVPAESVMLPVSGMESGKMADDPVVAVLKNGKLTRRSRKQLRKQVNAIQKDIDRLDKAVRDESYRQAHPAPTADDVRETVSTFGQDAGKRLAGAGAATAAALAPLIERAQGLEVPKGAQQAAERAQKNVSQFASSAQKGVRQFADTTREQTADLSDRVRGDLLPQLASQASKVQERVQEQVQQLRDEVLPQVVERAQQLRDDVTPQIADAAAKVGTQASTLAGTGVALGRDKAKSLANTDVATELTGRAKRQTYKGRKAAAKHLSALAAQLEPPKQKSNLSGLWVFAVLAAIGGALYYFVFRDEARRKKVVETTQSIIEQGREIVRDFRGYDEEF